MTWEEARKLAELCLEEYKPVEPEPPPPPPQKKEKKEKVNTTPSKWWLPPGFGDDTEHFSPTLDLKVDDYQYRLDEWQRKGRRLRRASEVAPPKTLNKPVC